MAWSHPRTWSVSDLASAALLNAGIRDNLIALGSMTQAGSTTITTTTANTPVSSTITFPVAFPSTPNVVALANTSAVGTIVIGVGVTGVSSTGCTLWATQTGTGTHAIGIQWLASAGPYT